MFVCRPPSAVFSAGAITVAKRIGVSSGTRICRGLAAVSAARLRASVASAFVARTRAGLEAGSGRATGVAAIGWSFLGSGGSGQLGAGQLQVDVIEGRGARGQAGSADAAVVDGADRGGGRAPRQRDRQRRTDGERRARRDAALAQRCQG